MSVTRSTIRVIAAALAMTTNAGAMAAPTIADTMVDRTATDRVTVSWSAKGVVDVYVADAANATIKTARLVSPADGDGRFDFVETGPTRSYFLLRARTTGATSRVAERLIPLEKGSNFRDIGGYEAAGGKHVRWGLIYRSGATPLLTDADLARVKALGLKDMIDLRSSEERVLAPTRITGMRYSAVNYPMMSMMAASGPIKNGAKLYHNFPSFLAPQLRLVFDDLLRSQKPMVYNCSAGQDRTGFATAMVLSALGVPRATIVADYHLSTTYRRPANELPPIDDAMAKSSPVAAMFAGYQKMPGGNVAQPLKEADGTPFLAGAFAEIDAKWGSVDGYLAKEIGLSKADLARLRLLYLE
jgi:protein-tyrosine phosphatase